LLSPCGDCKAKCAGLKRDTNKIPFHPYFTTKDIVGFVILFTVLSTLSLK
jgi:quinol-cytochrome oxidoreductase complex cytochrome b subunit